MSAAPESSPLFTPYRLKGLALPNRFVMPAMQRGMCADGSPRPELAAYYRRRAEGGVKLIVGESAAIDHETATRQPTSGGGPPTAMSPLPVRPRTRPESARSTRMPPEPAVALKSADESPTVVSPEPVLIATTSPVRPRVTSPDPVETAPRPVTVPISTLPDPVRIRRSPTASQVIEPDPASTT